MEKICIEIPSISENIKMVETLIYNAKEKFKLNQDVYGNIMVSVTEAVNNAIKHGNKNNATKKVILVFTLEENIIRFEIEDQGTGFDYQNLPDPTDPENIEKISGRGVFLMKHLSDEIIFKQGGKIVELIFYINS